MKITFILGQKQTIVGNTKTTNHVIYVRSYIDGDENPEKLKNAAVEEFDLDFNLGTSDPFLKKSLSKYFQVGVFTDNSSWRTVLPQDFSLPDSFTIKQLAETLKHWYLDEQKVPLIHIKRRL